MPCERLNGSRPLRKVAIGPDDSVFVIDANGILWRYSAQDGTFERIRGEVAGANVAEVSVGPRGRPWIVDSLNHIYATTFFGRNEKQDEDLASNTSQATEPPEPAITFSKYIRFRSVPYGGGCHSKFVLEAMVALFCGTASACPS